MHAQARRSSRDGIRAGVNLAAGCDIPSGELEHVLESGLELLAICRRQAADPGRILVARGKVLDLPLPAENAVGDVAWNIRKVRIAQHAIILQLPLQGAPAHAAPFVVQRGIEVRAAANRIRDHSIQLGPVGQEGRPGQELPFLERTQLLRRHDGFGEAPDMLDDVHSVADRAGSVVGVAEDHEARLVGFIGCDRIGAGVPVVVLREPCEIGFVAEPGPHHLADIGFRDVVGELQPAARVKEPRKILGVLAARAQRLGRVLQRDDRGHAVVDEQLAHVLFPVHMGIEQSRDDEFSAEVEHLCARRRGGVGGQHVADDVSLDQQGAIAQRRVGDAIDDRRAFDEKCRRRLRPDVGRRAEPENRGDKQAEN